MNPNDSFEKSGKSKCKTKKFGMGSDVALTTWKQWKWRWQREDDGRGQTTSFVLRMTEPENGLPVRRPVSPVLVLKVSISLWRRSSSKLVEAVWVSEHHWLLSLSADLSSFGWMSHYRRFPFPVSLYHLRGRLCFLLLASRSPCSSWRGMRRSSILMTCHIHRSWAWWVRPQCQYTLHGPGPLGLWYSLANACQVWNGGHASESSPAVWHPFGTVSKSRIHTAQRSRL